MLIIDLRLENIKKKKIPWSCDSWRRIRGEWEVGLGGMVVMMGAPEITEAGMCVLSWSILGLDGSSADGTKIQ